MAVLLIRFLGCARNKTDGVFLRMQYRGSADKSPGCARNDNVGRRPSVKGEGCCRQDPSASPQDDRRTAASSGPEVAALLFQIEFYILSDVIGLNL